MAAWHATLKATNDDLRRQLELAWQDESKARAARYEARQEVNAAKRANEHLAARLAEEKVQRGMAEIERDAYRARCLVLLRGDTA